MGAQHQPDRHAAQTSKSGHTLSQTVVELVGVSHSGLVFWSRHYMEITAELQMRLHRRALKGAPWVTGLRARKGWLQLRGFVVQCLPARRNDGTVGFQVAIVFDPSMFNTASETSETTLSSHPSSGCFGLN